MNKEPDIIISIGGSHAAKGILGVVIANALKQADVKNIAHLNYDAETFEQLTKAVNESTESKLSTANVLIVEFEEDFIDNMHTENEDTETSKNDVEKGGLTDE